MWSKKETDKLLELVDEYGFAWLEISRIMKRTPDSVRMRYRNVKGETCQTSGENKIEEKIEDFTKENERIINSKSPRITTLDQLIYCCKIDLSVWKIDRHVINKWEVYGTDFGLKNLIQVKAWLSKIKPEAVKPVISPININVGKTRQVATEKENYAILITVFGLKFIRNDIKNTILFNY